MAARNTIGDFFIRGGGRYSWLKAYSLIDRDTLDPSDIAGTLLNWSEVLDTTVQLDGNDGIEQVNAFVGGNFSQPAVSSRPKINRFALNTRPSAKLDGINDQLGLTSVFYTLPITYYFVFKPNSWTNGDIICDGISLVSTALAQASPNQFYLQVGTVPGANFIKIPNNDWVIIKAVYDDPSSFWRVNGTSSGMFNLLAVDPLGLSIGSLSNGIGPIAAEYAAWVVVGGAVADGSADDNIITNYFKDKYRIVW